MSINNISTIFKIFLPILKAYDMHIFGDVDESQISVPTNIEIPQKKYS
jgi:hypothetical protein